MTPFQCGHCGHPVFFDNHQCNQCGALLAYQPDQRAMVALGPDGRRSVGGRDHGQACANRQTDAACNWLVTDAPAQTPDPAASNAPAALCRSCRLTRVIPDLSVPGNGERWRRIEQAKRRVVYSLIGLGLAPEPPALSADGPGLSFDLLGQVPGGDRVLTGHADGVITINIVEADDAEREAIRVAMGEPVRSLLGHLRHEVSHYLQYRWLRTPDALDACRAAFGDERQDYAAALARHHAEGPPADWAQHFISAYASAHPWEDWAETCAHVLLVADALETAARWGVQFQGPQGPQSPLAAQAATGPALTTARPEAAARGDNADSPESAGASIGRQAVQQWLPIAGFVNAMNRSLGLPDAYPYLMPNAVLHKMDTVQALLADAANSPQPQPMT